MRKVVDGLMKVIQRIMGALLACAVLLVLVQVFFRYLLKAPLGWTDQLCRFLFVWIVFLGLPVLFHKKAATAFDLLSSHLKGRPHEILQMVICLLTAVFAVAFFIFSWQFMMKKGHQMIPAFRMIPYYAVYASMPLSAVLLFVEEVLQFSEALVNTFKGKEKKA